MSHIGYLNKQRRLAEERRAKQSTATERETDMSSFVSAAPPSGGIQWADIKGKLLIIEPKSFEPAVKTSFGDNDAVKADVFALTGPTESEDYLEALVFPRLLVSQLKGQIGKKVVGRLGQGAAKPGQSAPWLLEEASADDIAKAEAWLAARPSSSVTSAAAPF